MQLKLPSVPAYSFGKTRRELSGAEGLPGPGQYDEEKFGELSRFLKAPRATISKAGMSNSTERDPKPGPTDYDTNVSYLSKKGIARLGSSARDTRLGHSVTPGPGSYETSVSSLKMKGIAPIKSSRETSKIEIIPGPGNYDTNKSSFTKRGVAALKSRGHGDLHSRESLPGPLDYEPYAFDEKSKSRIGIKIPAAKRSIVSKETIPGPASYELNYSSLSKRGFAMIRSGRRNLVKDITPGPGNYETSVSSLNRKGIAKLPSLANHINSNSNIPGPGDYDLNAGSRTDRGPTIPKSGREMFRIESLPGPLDYDAATAFDKATMKRGAGFVALKAQLQPRVDPTPGPASYETMFSSLSKKGQAVIPKASRENSALKNTPGPGDYQVEKILERDRKKGITIPQAGKTQKVDVVPGPGQYNYISSVPDVAKYLQSGKK